VIEEDGAGQPSNQERRSSGPVRFTSTTILALQMPSQGHPPITSIFEVWCTMMDRLDLTYSLADQHFERTRSLGVLNFSLQFLRHLAQRPELRRLIVLNNSTLEGEVNLPSQAKHEVHDIAISGRWGRMYWDQVGAYGAAKKTGNEWLFLPKGFASFMQRCPARLAGCLADVMPEYYQRHYHDAFSRIELRYFLLSMRAVLRQAVVLFTTSDFSRNEIARVATERGWRQPRLRTMGIGFVRPGVRIPKENRLIVLASPFPHKRTAMAIEYMSQWQQATGYVGSVHWVGRLPGGISLRPFSNWKHELRPPEPEYRELIGRSKALVFTSEYEGFGMPPVEAVLAGACPVYSSIPATQEVMGRTGCPFSNESYESFAAAMSQAFRVSDDALNEWANQLLARHNWDKVVDVVLSEIMGASCSL
jgi:glycosyl transferase family 1